MDEIDWESFAKVGLYAGTIVKAEDFPEARKPAYKLWVDFGEKIGIKKSSAQITANYTAQNLVNTQVLCVVNFPPKQVGSFMSEVLVTGFPDSNGNIVLARPEKKVPDGSQLF